MALGSLWSCDWVVSSQKIIYLGLALASGLASSSQGGVAVSCLWCSHGCLLVTMVPAHPGGDSLSNFLPHPAVPLYLTVSPTSSQLGK